MLDKNVSFTEIPEIEFNVVFLVSDCLTLLLILHSTFTKSLTVTTSWSDVGISGADLATGSYIIQVLVDNYDVSGGQYSEYYTDSLFVKAAQSIGKCVYGMTDWIESNYEYDYLMTNPPFSIKDAVIEKVAKSGKPSALILPLDSLGGVNRHRIFNEYGYPAVYVPTKRISYFDVDWVKKEGSNFHSVILLFHTNREGIIWESKKSVLN